MIDLRDKISRVICYFKGHKWISYTVATGYWSYDIEQAGYCERCRQDTHGEYKEVVDEYMPEDNVDS